MKNRITQKNRVRSGFLFFILMTVFSMSGFSQMYIRGGATADPSWNTPYEMTARNIDGTGTSSYSHLHQATFTGTHEWKFVNTPDWSGQQWGMQNWEADASPNNFQTWTFYGDNARAGLTEGKFYTLILKAVDDTNSEGYVFETSAAPVTITSVDLSSTPSDVEDAIIIVTANQAPTDEKVYIYYTINGEFPAFSLVTFEGNTGTTTIPAQPIGTTVSYYAFTTCVDNIYAVTDVNLATLNFNNNNSANGLAPY